MTAELKNRFITCQGSMGLKSDLIVDIKAVGCAAVTRRLEKDAQPVTLVVAWSKTHEQAVFSLHKP